MKNIWLCPNCKITEEVGVFGYASEYCRKYDARVFFKGEMK